MKPRIAILIVLLALAVSAAADDQLRLLFTGGATTREARYAAVDLGSVSHEQLPSSRSATSRQRIGLRAESDDKTVRIARLTASLTGNETKCRIRVNGVQLSTTPVLIDPMFPVGVTVPFTLEVEVPRDASAGPLSESITWTVETR